MNLSVPVFGTFLKGKNTQTAGTAIIVNIFPRKGAKIRIGQLNYTSGTTVHNLIFMRPQNYATVTKSALQGATAVTLDKDPGVFSANWQFGSAPLVADNAMAANDYYCVELADGTFLFDTVSAVPTSYPGAITINTALPGPSGATAVLAGARFWMFGVSSDTDPRTGLAFESVETIASKTDYPVNEQTGLGIATTLGLYEPMMIYDANATAADTIERVTGYYGQQ